MSTNPTCRECNTTKRQVEVTTVFDRNIRSTAPLIINIGGARSSKCLERGTEIVMFSGELRPVEDVGVGDLVMGLDSRPRRVLECHSGTGKLYEVRQSKGINYVVNENHVLSLERSIDAKKPQGGLTKAGTQRRPNGRYPGWGDVVSISVKDYLGMSKRWKRNFYGYRVAIDFKEIVTPIEPYFLGLWLGDGSKHVTAITTPDPEIKLYLEAYASRLGMHLVTRLNQGTRCPTLSITNGNAKGMGRSKNPLHNKLRGYNLLCNKHIPDEYLYNSRERRLELLAGLIDSDGGLHKNGFNITQKDRGIAEQIVYLAASLGFRTSIVQRIATVKRINYSCEVSDVAIYGDVHLIPTRVVRKQLEKDYAPHFNPRQSGIMVEPMGTGKYYGFSLDGDGLFLLKDFTVVHNSFSIIQLLVQKFVSEPNKEILIARKTLPSLRLTAYKVFVDLLHDYNYYEHCVHNKSNLTIKYKGSTVYFMSIDDPEKIKSAEFNYVFMEEANELTYLDFMIIWMRMSAKTIPEQPNVMYLALNPSDEFSWVNQKVIHWDNAEVIRSTYLDNPFLSEEYRKTLEDMKEIDEELYKIYALGEYATLSNTIYRNYKVDSVFPKAFHDECRGLDFGFNVPAALLRVQIRDGEAYLTEEIYQTHLTNNDLIALMDELEINKKTPIYADSAEPKSIEDLCLAGYNVLPANKQVLDGIKFVKQYKLHLWHESLNLTKEIRMYKWRKDKNGVILDEPVKLDDHLADCARMSLYTHLKGDSPKQKVATPRGR